jgi:hypothetical protein
LFRSLSGFREKKIPIRVCSIEAKIHTDFYQGHFDLLNWNLGSHVKNFNRKPEENKMKAVSYWRSQKKLDLQNSFFFDEFFYTGSKTGWDKLHKF